MKVFDRWSNYIFQSTNLEVVWNGTFRGQVVQQGIYIWIVRYTIGEQSNVRTGDVK